MVSAQAIRDELERTPGLAAVVAPVGADEFQLWSAGYLAGYEALHTEYRLPTDGPPTGATDEAAEKRWSD